MPVNPINEADIRKINVSNNRDYALLAELYGRESRHREENQYTRHGWSRRQAGLGAYSLLINRLTTSTYYMEVTGLINSGSIEDLIRTIEKFRDAYQEDLATYFGWSDLSTIQEKIDLGNRLITKLLQA